MKLPVIRTCLLLVLITLLLTPSGFVLAADSIATVTGVTGDVDLLRGGTPPAVRARLKDPLTTGDIVRTKSGSGAEVTFTDGSLLKIAQRSRIDIGAYAGKGGTARLARGSVEAVVDPARVRKAAAEGKGKIFEIHTPNAVAGVRGTRFFVTHDRDLTGVLVREGTVYVYNLHRPDREVVVEAGNLVTISGDAPPAPPRKALDAESGRLEKEFAPGADARGNGVTGWGGTDTVATPVAAVTPGSAPVIGLTATESVPLTGPIPAGTAFPEAAAPTPPPPPPPVPPANSTPVTIGVNFP